MNRFTKMAEAWVSKNRASAEIPLEPVVPEADPLAWAEDFHIWALSQCVYHDRCFSGISALHRDFTNWAIAREVDPCTVETFKWLLDNAGFFSADGMVSGLILKEDFDGVRAYPEINRVLC